MSSLGSIIVLGDFHFLSFLLLVIYKDVKVIVVLLSTDRITRASEY